MIMSTSLHSEGTPLPAPPLPPFPYEPPTGSWAADPGFYDWRQLFPFLRHLRAEWRTIRDEVCTRGSNSSFIPWPETTLYHPEEGHEWRVVPFLHTFPGDDPTKSVWLASSAAAFPSTAALLHRIPGIRTALLSRMGPKTSLASHQGWALLSNHVLRCHLALDIPDGDKASTSGLVVDDAVAWHAEGEILVFDDSHIHSAFNNHPARHRVVLIVDIERPATCFVPPGISEGGTTAELEAFMQYFQ